MPFSAVNRVGCSRTARTSNATARAPGRAAFQASRKVRASARAGSGPTLVEPFDPRHAVCLPVKTRHTACVVVLCRSGSRTCLGRRTPYASPVGFRLGGRKHAIDNSRPADEMRSYGALVAAAGTTLAQSIIHYARSNHAMAVKATDREAQRRQHDERWLAIGGASNYGSACDGEDAPNQGARCVFPGSRCVCHRWNTH